MSEIAMQTGLDKTQQQVKIKSSIITNDDLWSARAPLLSGHSPRERCPSPTHEYCC
jgi:hypothetical protein